MRRDCLKAFTALSSAMAIAALLGCLPIPTIFPLWIVPLPLEKPGRPETEREREARDIRETKKGAIVWDTMASAFSATLPGWQPIGNDNTTPGRLYGWKAYRDVLTMEFSSRQTGGPGRLRCSVVVVPRGRFDPCILEQWQEENPRIPLHIPDAAKPAPWTGEPLAWAHQSWDPWEFLPGPSGPKENLYVLQVFLGTWEVQEETAEWQKARLLRHRDRIITDISNELARPSSRNARARKEAELEREAWVRHLALNAPDQLVPSVWRTPSRRLLMPMSRTHDDTFHPAGILVQIAANDESQAIEYFKRIKIETLKRLVRE